MPNRGSLASPSEFKIVLNKPNEDRKPILGRCKKAESRKLCDSPLGSGTTGNRTRDTRIFSPLLYQLSYGTIIMLIISKQVQR